MPTQAEWAEQTPNIFNGRGHTHKEVTALDTIFASGDHQIAKASFASAIYRYAENKCGGKCTNTNDNTRTDEQKKFGTRFGQFAALNRCVTERLTAGNTAFRADPAGFLAATPVLQYGSSGDLQFDVVTYSKDKDNKITQCFSSGDGNRCWPSDLYTSAESAVLEKYTPRAADTNMKLFAEFPVATYPTNAEYNSFLARAQQQLMSGGAAVIVPTTVNVGAQHAAFLPFTEGRCSFMLLPDWATLAFTAQLSGCFLFVATKDNSPTLFIHANSNSVAVGVNPTDLKNTCATQILSLHDGYTKKFKLTTTKYGTSLNGALVTAYGVKTSGTWSWKAIKLKKAALSDAVVEDRYAEFESWA